MPIDLSRIQALCFDVDGTLNDTDDQFVDRAAPFFRAIRWLLPGQDYQRAARRFVMWAEAPGNALIGVPDFLGIDDDLAKIVNWMNQKRKAQIKHFRPIEGVVEMLEGCMAGIHWQLSARGMRIRPVSFCARPGSRSISSAWPGR